MTDEAPNLSELMVRFQRFEEQAWRVSEPAAAMIRAVLGEQIALLGGDVPASVDPHAHPLYRAAQLRLREDAALAEAETDTRQPLPTSEVRIDRVPDLQVTPSRAPVYDDDNPRYEDLSLYELEPAEPLGVQLGTGEETDGGSVAFRLEDMPEPAEVDPDQPRLVLHAGTEEEEQLSLDSEGEITLGRGKSCTIRLRDARASRVHCRVWLDGDAWMVEDLGSANGTLVNGEFLPSRTPKPLGGGEEVVIGSSVIRFESPEPVAAS